MKLKMKNLNRKGLLWCAILTVTMFSLSSCLDDDSNVEPTEVADVLIYNASPEAEGLDVIVGGNTIQLAYAENSPYLNFIPGNRELRVNSLNADNVLVDTTITFEAAKFYSLFIAEKNEDLSLLAVRDSVSTPASGKAMVRVIHLSPDGEAVDLVQGDGTTWFQNQAFKNATAFKEIDAENYDLQVNATGTSTQLLSIPDVDFLAGGIYTVIVRGYANPPAGNSNALSAEILRNN